MSGKAISLISAAGQRVLLRVIRVGSEFVNVCGSQKAERISRREAPKCAGVWIPTKSPGQSPKRGAEAAMAAVASNAEVKNESLEALYTIPDHHASSFDHRGCRQVPTAYDGDGPLAGERSERWPEPIASPGWLLVRIGALVQR
jgi:hypothetical protein